MSDLATALSIPALVLVLGLIIHFAAYRLGRWMRRNLIKAEEDRLS